MPLNTRRNTKGVKDIVLALEEFMIHLGAVLYNLGTFVRKTSRVN
jgi:hypothetical protein